MVKYVVQVTRLIYINGLILPPQFIHSFRVWFNFHDSNLFCFRFYSLGGMDKEAIIDLCFCLIVDPCFGLIVDRTWKATQGIITK